ncbi:MAG TPA: 50S ribosomal protein L17 [Sediminispirochaeta sp.]|nr:50S ribosomal protein L17 [Sediminispirochaeta sp.]
MKHKIGFNRLGRKASHRKALHRNMTTSLFRYERIKTTKAKALAIRRTAEKMITRAKEDSVHNRRVIAKDILDKEIVAKLFNEIGPRYKERPGGYTRVLKLGYRKGDAAEMVLLELVESELVNKPKKAKPKKVEAVKEETEVVSEESSEETARTEAEKSTENDSARDASAEDAGESRPEEEKE